MSNLDLNFSPRWIDYNLGITGYGHAYPGQLVFNEKATGLEFGSVDHTIIGSIDVLSRYVSDEQDDIVELAAEAAACALKDADVVADDVDLLIMSNWTDRQFVPEYAPRVATRIGANSAFSFNVCGACTGFIHGTQQAAAYLASSSSASTAVVVSVDRFSRRVRPGSKGQLVVGDAAGAVVIQKASTSYARLIDTVLRSDGRHYEATTVLPPLGYIKSKPELVDLALESNLWSVESLLDRNNLSIKDIDWLVPHPGTSALHQKLFYEVGISTERFVTNFEVRGNTGSASIPIVLSEMKIDGRLRPGNLVMIIAVGSGWYYGGGLFRV